jgi:hypothetical protein
MWFRKEPDVRWLSGPGTDPVVVAEALSLVREFLTP